jgi:hypothetical protein
MGQTGGFAVLSELFSGIVHFVHFSHPSAHLIRKFIQILFFQSTGFFGQFEE